MKIILKPQAGIAFKHSLLCKLQKWESPKAAIFIYAARIRFFGSRNPTTYGCKQQEVTYPLLPSSGLRIRKLFVNISAAMQQRTNYDMVG